MNKYASLDENNGELKDYYDSKGNRSTPTQEALKKRRKKHGESYGLDVEIDMEAVEDNLREKLGFGL